MTIHKPFIKRPKNIYLAAILIVILLIVSTQVITQYSLYIQQQKEKFLGLVEMQGILSQKIAKLALKIKEDNNNEKAIAEIAEVNHEWNEVHQTLSLTDEKINLPNDQYETIERLMRKIQLCKDSISKAAITLVNVSSPVERLHQIEVIQHHEVDFILLIDELEWEWYKITEKSLRNFRDIELVLAIVSLLVLSLKLFLIILPAFRDLTEKNKALKAAYDEQEALNEELIATEEELRQSLDYQTEITNHLEEAKQKAEDASKAKELFLSTMSHEIRTPMNAVIGLTYLLLEDDPKPSQVENLQALKFSGDTLLSLINDILDFSKIEAGKIELEETRFSLKHIFKGIKQSLGANTIEKGIALNCHLASDIPEVLLGDPTRLSQILNNLVSNAIKFTLQGEVNLRAELDHITEENTAVTFTVQDTGIGIAEDKLDDIFQSFSQAGKDTTRKYGGTGLGLAISKKLIEIQHSQIKVESKVNEGSTFTFTLVFKYMQGETDYQAATLNSNIEFGLSGTKMLVAEDNHMNIIVIRQFLSKWGVNFHTVPNGQLAVEAVKKEPYDLILMDLEMPEMDGLTASREIRKFNQEIPIIALTASALLEVQEKVFTAGMNDYATKPFIPGELFSKIEKQIRRLSGKAS